MYLLRFSYFLLPTPPHISYMVRAPSVYDSHGTIGILELVDGDTVMVRDADMRLRLATGVCLGDPGPTTGAARTLNVGASKLPIRSGSSWKQTRPKSWGTDLRTVPVMIQSVAFWAHSTTTYSPSRCSSCSAEKETANEATSPSTQLWGISTRSNVVLHAVPGTWGDSMRGS